MLRLPTLSGRKVIDALSKLGYKKIRQRSSHIRLSCFGKKFVTVPDYKNIGRGLLRKILRDAEVTPQEFEKLLK